MDFPKPSEGGFRCGAFRVGGGSGVTLPDGGENG